MEQASGSINLETLRGLTNALLAANKPDEVFIDYICILFLFMSVRGIKFVMLCTGCQNPSWHPRVIKQAKSSKSGSIGWQRGQCGWELKDWPCTSELSLLSQYLRAGPLLNFVFLLTIIPS